jgi:hypothetical protein
MSNFAGILKLLIYMIAYVDLNITINTIAAMMTPKCGDVVHGIEDTALIHFKISMRLLSKYYIFFKKYQSSCLNLPKIKHCLAFPEINL